MLVDYYVEYNAHSVTYRSIQCSSTDDYMTSHLISTSDGIGRSSTLYRSAVGNRPIRLHRIVPVARKVVVGQL